MSDADEWLLRKQEVLVKQGALATYSVLRNGVKVGDVTKYERRAVDDRQRRSAARQTWVTYWNGRLLPDRELSWERGRRSDAFDDVRVNYRPELGGA